MNKINMAARRLYAVVEKFRILHKCDGVELFCLRAQGKHLANTWRNYKKQRSYQKQSKKYKNVHANHN